MHKLKNQQGATLMMALLLLLAASMVSAVILTAATSSARRLENDRAARQAYLTVSSAARLLRDDILNASFVQETVKTTYTNDTSTETSRETTSPTGFTAAWLKAGKAAVDRDSGKSFTDTITLSVDGLDDVSAVFTMAPNYDITIVLHLADGGDSDCRLVLTLRENKADPTISTVSGGDLLVAGQRHHRKGGGRIKKLNSTRGETLVETLVSILIIVLTFVFLTTAAVSAAKINAKVRSADISFHYSSAVSNGTAALTASGGGTRSGRTTVQVYEDNGCLYYEEVTP